MNVVWLALIVVAIAVAAFTGSMEEVTNAAMDSAGSAVTLAIGLIGVMALWLGLMRIAEEAGLIQLLARLLRPVLRRIFPEVPADHPAMGSMLSNIAANMLGLGNSATALGLRAMKDLQGLNRDKSSASNSMATFLAINTSSVTLIPATVIAIRASANSNSPAEIIGPVILATAVSTTVGITAARLLQRVVPAQKGADITGDASDNPSSGQQNPGMNTGGTDDDDRARPHSDRADDTPTDSPSALASKRGPDNHEPEDGGDTSTREDR